MHPHLALLMLHGTLVASMSLLMCPIQLGLDIVKPSIGIDRENHHGFWLPKKWMLVAKRLWIKMHFQKVMLQRLRGNSVCWGFGWNLPQTSCFEVCWQTSQTHPSGAHLVKVVALVPEARGRRLGKDLKLVYDIGSIDWNISYISSVGILYKSLCLNSV